MNQSLVHSNKPLIVVQHPFKAFIDLLNHFYPPKKPKPGIHPSAVIADNVRLGQDVFIGPYVVIGSGSSIR